MANKLSKRYLKAKEEFLKIEKPTEKSKRLYDEEKKAWEAYLNASKLSSEYDQILMDEIGKYEIETEKVNDKLSNWYDRNDWLDVRFPIEVGVDEFPF